MKYKAIVFDMDGTLLDTMSGIIKACNLTFKYFGFDVTFTNDDGKYFIGAGSAEFARRALARANIPELDLMKFREVFLSNYEIYQKTGTKIFDGLDRLLTELKENGYKIAICSNKPQELLNQVTAQMYPGIKFDTVVGQRAGIPCKPDPKMFEITKQELGIKNNDEILYVGDSEYDFDFAKNSNVDICIVKYGYGQYEKDFMNHVTYSANSVSELSTMLLKK